MYVIFKDLELSEKFLLGDIPFVKIGNNADDHLPTKYQLPNCINLENNHRCVVSARSKVERMYDDFE